MDSQLEISSQLGFSETSMSIALSDFVQKALLSLSSKKPDSSSSNWSKASLTAAFCRSAAAAGLTCCSASCRMEGAPIGITFRSSVATSAPQK
eukprot:COSAG04_NODE_3468_length_2792_cov_1.360936_5_plen_93_part_00